MFQVFEVKEEKGMKRKRIISVMLSVVMAFAVSAFAMPAIPADAASTGEVPMYRLYNPNSGEHFYTQSLTERENLIRVGWKDEGKGWTAPEKSNTPVYRLYNPVAGDHHYTMSKAERDSLITAGWNSEGIGWYSDDEKSVPLYREYNPNAATGTHNYTASKSEHDYLVFVGWVDEEIGWYGLSTQEQGEETKDELNKISLSETRIYMKAGDVKSLRVIYDPANYISDERVLWASSNNSVASVNTEGVITAVSAGKATIKAFVNGKSASCEVNVEAKSGVEILKEYLVKNGTRTSNYYACSSHAEYYTVTVAYFDNGNIIFLNEDRGNPEMPSNASITIINNTTNVEVESRYQDLDENSFTISSFVADNKKYDANNDELSFLFARGNKDFYDHLPLDLLNSTSNQLLKISFALWSGLCEEMGTTINDVAYSSYSGI